MDDEQEQKRIYICSYMYILYKVTFIMFIYFGYAFIIIISLTPYNFRHS